MFRAEFVGATARQEHRGVPLDLPLLNRIRHNWDGIRPISSPNWTVRSASTRSWTASRIGGGNASSTTCAESMTWLTYPRRLARRARPDFREMEGKYPHIGPLRELRYSLSKLRLNDLQVGNDGRNRTLLGPTARRPGAMLQTALPVRSCCRRRDFCSYWQRSPQWPPTTRLTRPSWARWLRPGLSVSLAGSVDEGGFWRAGRAGRFSAGASRRSPLRLRAVAPEKSLFERKGDFFSKSDADEAAGRNRIAVRMSRTASAALTTLPLSGEAQRRGRDERAWRFLLFFDFSAAWPRVGNPCATVHISQSHEIQANAAGCDRHHRCSNRGGRTSGHAHRPLLPKIDSIGAPRTIFPQRRSYRRVTIYAAGATNRTRR